jgi:hypothetical protein
MEIGNEVASRGRSDITSGNEQKARLQHSPDWWIDHSHTQTAEDAELFELFDPSQNLKPLSGKDACPVHEKTKRRFHVSLKGISGVSAVPIPHPPDSSADIPGFVSVPERKRCHRCGDEWRFQSGDCHDRDWRI